MKAREFTALGTFAMLMLIGCAHDDTAYMRNMTFPTPMPTAVQDFDPHHPRDFPLRRCTSPQSDDPLRQADRGVPGESAPKWKDNVETRVVYYLVEGDRAKRVGDTDVAVRAYLVAARFALDNSSREVWNNQDSLLRIGNALFGLGERTMAYRLWSTYLARSHARDYHDMARALKLRQFRRFFMLAVEDSTSYTKRIPRDLEGGGLQWLYAGAEQGARGHYLIAQQDFREAMNCDLWDPEYAVFAWGAAAYALGDRESARNAWVIATAEGDDTPGDMPFNNNANAAAVTMLLKLFR